MTDVSGSMGDEQKEIVRIESFWISSAYKLCHQILEADYPAAEWNTYPFHVSDGDNWSVDDTLQCFELLKTKLLPVSPKQDERDSALNVIGNGPDVMRMETVRGRDMESRRAIGSSLRGSALTGQ